MTITHPHDHDRFTPRNLRIPIVQAPMAGGPSTPELAAAVSNAGALGFLAAGYISPERLERDIAATRRLTTEPFGVNIFVPSPSAATPAALEAYREELIPDAARLGTTPGQPHPDDDSYAAKLDVVTTAEPALVSFTFGAPSRETIARLHRAGITVAITVTTLREAEIATTIGADVLVAQGDEAGGHRGTFDPTIHPATHGVDSLLAAIAPSTDLPIIAAGGLSTASDVQRTITSGATAAQAGTAFLLADEAGTKPTHARALRDARFTRTVLTTAFSGRYARSLENQFIRDHQVNAPLGYPEINQLTAPIRAAAAAAGDAERLNLWAGTGFTQVMPAPAATIVARLAGIERET